MQGSNPQTLPLKSNAISSQIIWTNENDKPTLMSNQDSVKPIKQGVIKKWTNMVHWFQKRFFVLNSEIITYYKKDGGVIAERGVISLKLAKVDPKTKMDNNMVINTGTMEIHLKFSNFEEKSAWYYAILECQQELTQRQQ